MLLKNVSALIGDDLKYVPEIDIRIQNQQFSQIRSDLISKSKQEEVNCDGLLVIPGFVNCHTHLGDSIAKDVFLDSTVDKRIHPVFGIKPRILQNTDPTHLVSFMKNSCISMMAKGITTFADFREGGLHGIIMLQQALSGLLIRPVILGRLELYCTRREIKQDVQFPKERESELDELLQHCDGLGISGANENSTSLLSYYSATPKIRAIHSAETIHSTSISKKTTGKSETLRALYLKPHFLVHMTCASKADMRAAARHSVGIVVCPRANAALAEGIPDIYQMLKSGCTVAMGTDNVMINSYDMFREMDYIWKATMGTHKKRIDPKDVFKMATVNGGKILRMNVGAIARGMLADCIFLDKHALDLEPMHNPHASIVHRASESSIRAVMIGGQVVYGKI